MILGHLSRENNFPELALEAVRNEFMEYWLSGEAAALSVAPRSEASGLVAL